MATREANEAVEVYRKLRKTELNVEKLERELTRRVNGLREGALADYVRMTQEIEEALEGVLTLADEADWSESTRQQTARRTVNHVGTDKEGEGS